jgi:hypothetical protein
MVSEEIKIDVTVRKKSNDKNIRGGLRANFYKGFQAELNQVLGFFASAKAFESLKAI